MRLTAAALLLLAAAPGSLLAQNVIPELPGAGRPVDLEYTRARRERLLQRLGNAVVAIPAAGEEGPQRHAGQLDSPGQHEAGVRQGRVEDGK